VDIPLLICPGANPEQVLRKEMSGARLSTLRIPCIDDNLRVAVVGLGYVGLPLAAAFASRFNTLGFDVDASRITELRATIDRTRELTEHELSNLPNLYFTTDTNDIVGCDVYIVTVPTPVNESNQPDLTPLERACLLVGQSMASRSVIVFESTVYPGATEEYCVPLLEEASGLRFNADFSVGYSPERINPGDKNHKISQIVKVTSGSTRETAEFVDTLYQRIISAGTHLAPSIRVAEAAKVIENVQRDVNIALINELSILFASLNLDTHEVLAAARTKWNFLDFTPGLVGGHCIGVDPYYLTYKAQQVGMHPELILAGRRTNDGMGRFVAGRVLELLAQRNIPSSDARVLVLGLTFKENCPDLRNTKVIDVIREFKQLGMQVQVHDPHVDAHDAAALLGFELLPGTLPRNSFDVVVLAVAHDEYLALSETIPTLIRPGGIVFDIKGMLPSSMVDGRL